MLPNSVAELSKYDGYYGTRKNQYRMFVCHLVLLSKLSLITVSIQLILHARVASFSMSLFPPMCIIHNQKYKLIGTGIIVQCFEISQPMKIVPREGD